MNLHFTLSLSLSLSLSACLSLCLSLSLPVSISLSIHLLSSHALSHFFLFSLPITGNGGTAIGNLKISNQTLSLLPPFLEISSWAQSNQVKGILLSFLPIFQVHHVKRRAIKEQMTLKFQLPPTPLQITHSLTTHIHTYAHSLTQTRASTISLSSPSVYMYLYSLSHYLDCLGCHWT